MTAVERLQRNLEAIGAKPGSKIMRGYCHEIFAPLSRAAVRQAKTKPRGMSDAAWRIELRRRADAARYDAAPHPDMVSTGRRPEF